MSACHSQAGQCHAGRSPGGYGRGLARAVAILAATLAVAGGAAAQTGRGGFDHEGLARQMLERHIRPLYGAFAQKSAALAAALDQGCQRRDTKDGAAIKAAFRDTVLAWSRVEHLHFGPAVEANRAEKIVFWPDRQKIGERQIAQMLSKSDATALSPEGLGQKSVAVQGLTALEIVLFGKSGDTLLADTPEGKFACGYATAIGGNVARIAKDIVAEWAEGGKFTALWLKPGDDNPLYKAANGPTFELLKAYRQGINIPREVKLLPSLGLKRTGPGGPYAPKSRPPYELSGLSLASIVANTEAALDLFDAGGFAERLAATEPETAKQIKADLQTVLAGLREVEPAGPAAFNDKAQSDKLAGVREPFVSALLAGGEALAKETGMALGFTDDDGD